MRDKLSIQAIKAIRSQNDLYSSVCQILGIMPVTLAGMLTRQTRRLTEHAVIETIKEHTGMPASQIIESKVVPNSNIKSIAGKKRALTNTK